MVPMSPTHVPHYCYCLVAVRDSEGSRRQPISPSGHRTYPIVTAEVRFPVRLHWTELCWIMRLADANQFGPYAIRR